MFAASVLAAPTSAQNAPPNNQCQEAITIGLGSVPFTTVGATTDGPPLPPQCDKGFGLSLENDIWFFHVATFSGMLEVSTCGAANFDTRLAGYEAGAGCGALTILACNDDGAGCPLFTSIMQMPVFAGKSYYIRLGAFVGSGSGVLTLTDQLSPICVPSDHGCFEPGLPGCNDIDCCTAVCASDPFCCVAAWDFVCVAIATGVCNDCGVPEAGSCCAPGTSPSCSNAACCEAVCAVDAFCCQVQWDLLCAAEAELIEACGCEDSPPLACAVATHGCYETGPAGCDDDACCAAICSVDPFCCEVAWDQLCVDAAVGLCPGCGSPLAGSCCFAGASTHCEDQACCAAICADDPFCCTVNWDGVCAEAARRHPACDCDFSDACPGVGPCDAPARTPGCADETCCAAVCALDPFCCGVAWDMLCVGAAGDLCPAPCPEDLNGDGAVDGADLGLLLSVWATDDPAADLNADGKVDGGDLGILLQAWGVCGG